MPNKLSAVVAVSLWLITRPFGAAAEPVNNLPDASTVMQHVVERARVEDQNDLSAKYAYEKRSVVEELDAAGKATKTTEEVYSVFPIEGVPFSRLIRIQNRDLTVKEVKEQDRKQEEFRKNLTRKGVEPGGRTNESWLDPALVDHFIFHTEGRETIDHRSMLRISFSPKVSGAKEKSVADRVLNRLAGTLWVDEQEWEIARLKVGLTAELSLGWFGMVGCIKQLDMDLNQTRLPEGVWMSQRQSVAISGRKVFSAMRYRTIEESSKFRKPSPGL